jgi:hypothetical protein
MKELVKKLNEIPYYYKAEAVIAELVNQGMSKDDVIINFESAHKKNWEKDILKYETTRNKLLIFLSRDGLFHSLPEYLFLKPVSGTRNENEETIKFNSKQRQHIKSLFFPIENEIFMDKVELERQFNDILRALSTSEAEFVHHFWKLNDNLDPVDKARLCKMLPEAHSVAGDFELTSRFLGFLLGYEVEWSSGKYENFFTFDQDKKRNNDNLGNYSCGNMISGGGLTEYFDVLTFCIKDVPVNMLEQFMSGKKKANLIKTFTDYFVPLQYDVEIEIDVVNTESEFCIGTSMMGLNSVI